MSRLVGRLRADPELAVSWALAAALTLYVIVVPLALVTYPPITDLPFHAAQTSILRHYFDPAWHFREQFSLHPIEVPYASMYALGALFALVVPIAVATKLMAIAMLLLLPIGLAVMFSGMKKSPWLGLLGLALVWCTLTQWGFLNFMGALGLYAMSVGFSLKVVDDPTRFRKIALALTLVAIFFTHVYRYPFAALTVLATGAFLYPATGRFKPLLAPIAPSLALFGGWLVVRPKGDAVAVGDFTFDLSRLSGIPKHLFGAFLPPDGAPPTEAGNLERAIASQMLLVFVLFLFVITGLFFLHGRAKGRTRTERRWAVGVTALPIAIAGGLVLAYVTLPLEIGLWWYVYPREIVAAAFMLLGVVPDLPTGRLHRLAAFALLAIGTTRMSTFVSERYREFDALTEDFKQIRELVPRAPKLHYLIYARQGVQKRVSAFLHLPAWLQAERGGWLGFHFVTWNHSPIRYRQNSRSVPPSLPRRFEWTPQHFRVLEHGAWFDTFLVRHTIDPSRLFEPDPTVELVANRGTWWLYQRRVNSLPAGE